MTTVAGVNTNVYRAGVGKYLVHSSYTSHTGQHSSFELTDDIAKASTHLSRLVVRNSPYPLTSIPVHVVRFVYEDEQADSFEDEKRFIQYMLKFARERDRELGVFMTFTYSVREGMPIVLAAIDALRVWNI